MRVLILGGAGMLGHKLLQTLRGDFETWTTVRSLDTRTARAGLFDAARTISGLDATDFDAVAAVLSRVRPDAVINAVGVIKQRPEAQDPIRTITINALLPQRLLVLCRMIGARLIQISTDCVFSGRTGAYSETSPADADDLYGRTKWLGEIHGPGALTLRTSIIGRELASSTGLVEWFLGQPGPRVPGYTGARFSGLTTQALSRVIAAVLRDHRTLDGVYHVSGEPISKYDLLVEVRDAFGRRVDIEPRSEPVIDRTLDDSRFRAATGLTCPGWPQMVAELAADPTPYDDYRR